MSVIDEVLAANEIYSQTHELRRLTPRPERKLAVLTCMDTRLSIRTLGLKTGDAHIIRNAGGIVTEDSLRSLVVSHYLLGTEEFMVINHTDCGLMHTTEEDLRTRVQNRAGSCCDFAGFLLCLPEHRRKCAPSIAEAAHAPVDSQRGCGARVCLRCEQRKATGNPRQLKPSQGPLQSAGPGVLFGRTSDWYRQAIHSAALVLHYRTNLEMSRNGLLLSSPAQTPEKKGPSRDVHPSLSPR